jgi:uncharacterized membrane protein (UPF0127 family)
MPVRNRSFLKSAVAALFCFIALASPGRATEFRTEGLTIHRQDGKILNFVVELATDNAEREQGLMNREEMKPDRGMLFDFGMSRPVYMWMKNTYLPLDMLFISDGGKITHIRANTLPLSEDIIDSHGLVRFVLEINGGTSETLGIKVGDAVRSMQIERAKSGQ